MHLLCGGCLPLIPQRRLLYKGRRCSSTSHKSPSERCLKAHDSEDALVPQGVEMIPVIAGATIDVAEQMDPARSQFHTFVPLTLNYSPPEPYLLNSAFLI